MKTFFVKQLLLPTSLLLISLLKLVSSADTSQLITSLPGLLSNATFKQYAGHITIDSSTGKAFFYWFYEADAADSSSLPLVLWLNGGPGCSSVGAGALGELGPFRPDDSGKLTLNPHSWNKAANIIFLESPVGVGFSYSNTQSDYDSLDDESTATDNLSFLKQWFAKFPEFSKNDFYVTGESYAGHYIPTLATHILAYNAKGGAINFKGFAIGNAWTTSTYDALGNLEFLYSHSLISDEVYREARDNCFSSNGNSLKCSNAEDKIDELTQYVDAYNVYAPVCPSKQMKKTRSNLKSLQSGPRQQVLQSVYDVCDDPVPGYLNSKAVQAALHVENRPVEWSECSGNGYSDDDIAKSVVPLYGPLIKSGLRIWLYSGDFDSVVSTLSTRSWLTQLNLTIQTPWYAWDLNSQVGGWTEVYTGLTFTSIRGAGHMVPADQPAAALAMFKSFLQGKPLPTF